MASQVTNCKEHPIEYISDSLRDMADQAAPLSEETQNACNRCHPLHFITPFEISIASSIVKDALKSAGTSIRFKNISIHEPPKALLLPYLNAEAQGVSIRERPFVPRCLDVIWSSGNERKTTESVVSLDSNTIVDQSNALSGQHGPLDRYEASLSIPLLLTNISKI